MCAKKTLLSILCSENAISDKKRHFTCVDHPSSSVSTAYLCARLVGPSAAFFGQISVHQA